MPEVTGTQFFKAISATDPETREYKIVDAENRFITLTLHAIERGELFDELHRLPAGFIEIMMSGDVENLEEVEDPDDIDIDADATDVLKNIDGSVIDVFETLFSMSARHEDLTSIDMETIAAELDINTLIDAGGEITDLSLAESGSIKRFHEADSDKSS